MPGILLFFVINTYKPKDSLFVTIRFKYIFI
jgi:hypothetical protein